MTTTADSAKVERADGTLMGHDIDEAPELCWIAAQAHGGGYGMAYFGLTPESYDKVHYWGFFRSGFFAGPIPNEGYALLQCLLHTVHAYKARWQRKTAITVYTSCAYVRDVVEGNYDDNDINMHLIKAIERITTDSGKTFDGFPRRVAVRLSVSTATSRYYFR